MGAYVYHQLDRSAIKKLLTSSDGPVAREILRRSIKVESAAKRNISGTGGPKRVDTGRLRASITHAIVMTTGKPVGRVGTNVNYALYVHEGTGIYGPRGAYIIPKRSRFLVFTAKDGKTVFTKRVSGMKKNQFLKNALKAAKG